MERQTPQAFGYASFEELWQDYTVFTVVRNPYDRASSAYDYVLHRRKVCLCRIIAYTVPGRLVMCSNTWGSILQHAGASQWSSKNECVHGGT